MKTRFDLEQQILGLWGICDDLNLLADKIRNNEITNLDIADVLVGMAKLNNLKFAECFETYENLGFSK